MALGNEVTRGELLTPSVFYGVRFGLISGIMAWFINRAVLQTSSPSMFIVIVGYTLLSFLMIPVRPSRVEFFVRNTKYLIVSVVASFIMFLFLNWISPPA